MKSITVKKNDANQRLDKFLLKTFATLPKSLMFKEIRKKNIKVNRKRAYADQKLNENDVIDIYIKDELLEIKEKHYDFLDSSKKLSIIYENENILILNKEVGLLCHPDKNEYRDTLISRVERYLYEKKEWSPESENSFTPALANRIDRNTLGIVIAAKNAESLRELNKIIKERQIEKHYLAVVHGKMEKASDTLTAYLSKDENKNKVFVSLKPFEESKKIITKYTSVDYKNGLTLVDIDLITGRTHQIRAHFAKIGHPLLNDGKYGKEKGRYRQALCSYKIIFKEIEEEKLSYLSGKTFEIQNIDFVNDFQKGKLNEKKQER